MTQEEVAAYTEKGHVSEWTLVMKQFLTLYIC